MASQFGENSLRNSCLAFIQLSFSSLQRFRSLIGISSANYARSFGFLSNAGHMLRHWFSDKDDSCDRHAIPRALYIGRSNVPKPSTWRVFSCAKAQAHDSTASSKSSWPWPLGYRSHSEEGGVTLPHEPSVLSLSLVVMVTISRPALSRVRSLMSLKTRYV
ncbi:hypothetical protein TNCV_1866891 [Trichonephila clavipes]|nr:hypothetical protein TNCV_1866891 [Trichonephila clavipes]